MVDFNSFNDTTKYLSHLIFKPGSTSSLVSFGLQNVYIDDYSHRCKYVNCLLFLLTPPQTREAKSYKIFEEKIITFNSFYDYYDTKEGIMYVFKVPDGLIEDYNVFTSKRFDDLSETFWKSIGAKVPLDFSHVQFPIEEQIYRFEDNLILRNQFLKK